MFGSFSTRDQELNKKMSKEFLCLMVGCPKPQPHEILGHFLMYINKTYCNVDVDQDVVFS